jgi:hypothetical protein
MQVLAPLPQSSSGSAFILPGRAVQNQVHWRSYAGSGQTSKIQLQTRLTFARYSCAESGTLVQLCQLWPHLHNPAPDPPPFARYSLQNQVPWRICACYGHTAKSSARSAALLPGTAVHTLIPWCSCAGSGHTSAIQLRICLLFARYSSTHNGTLWPALATPPQSSSGSAFFLPGEAVHTLIPYSDTLVQLCRLWPHLHNLAPGPPPFCQV